MTKKIEILDCRKATVVFGAEEWPQSIQRKSRLQGGSSGDAFPHLLASFANGVFDKRSRCGMFLSAPKRSVQLGAFVTETAHGVTGVASLILLADIGDQRLRALHFDFERGDQCIFGVNNNVSRFALNFKANRKLHLCLPLSMFKNITQFSCEVELLGPVPFSMCEDMTKPTTGDQL